METKARLKKIDDLTNRKFHRLTVLHLDTERTRNDKYWRVFWICRCDCGIEKSIAAGSLRLNHTKSCGCWKIENSRNVCRKNFTKENTILPKRNVYTQYIARCKRKKTEFKISEKEFYELIENQCHYCGSNPKNTMLIRTSSVNVKEYHYNGIDRMDNNQGYVSGNVVSCCNICNRAKNTLSLTDFYKWIRLIHKNLELHEQYEKTCND